MFDSGKIYKVKVEVSPGKMGFGRVSVIDKIGNQLLVQLKTAKESNKVLPKGTPIWFIDDSPSNAFNGLWLSSVAGAQIDHGHTVMVVNTPKFEPAQQRRRAPRVALDVPVKLILADGSKSKLAFRSRDISRSGIAIETTDSVEGIENLEVGSFVLLVIESKLGDVQASCRLIRIEQNWLANKTIIGLEFANLNPQAIATLDKLLIFLGGQPRESASDRDGTKDVGTGSLANWLPGSKIDTSFVRKTDHSEPHKSDDKNADQDDKH